ncbi:MAG: prephenate dehydrogenase [Candidatus Omnitrophica bacterium]|nr:prephenate dehydrogenase [Candidatus Omnitrophota bacterium]
MILFNQVAIVGTGLIGGSIGMALKKNHICRQVIGVSFHKRSIDLAKRKKAIDTGSQSLKIIKDADLVILATPVELILKLAPQIARVIKKDCIIIDVGSTKEGIVAKLGKLFPNYIGTHPLTGSEKRGIVNAKEDLFKNSSCLLTPTRNTAVFVRKRIEELWVRLGARVFYLSPDKHDEALSFISHLPHIAAFALIGVIPGKFLNFASGGLKDTTRIAASDSELWTDIFLNNQKNLLRAIHEFEGKISLIKQAIKKKNRKLLNKILAEAKSKREAL